MAGYGTDEGLTAWAAENGYTLPVSPAKAVLRQRGSTYIDGVYGSRFPGVPAGGVEQERAWPRTGATAYGEDVAASAIPTIIVQASYLAAVQEGASPGSLSVVVTASQQVKREKVGPLEVEYQSSSGTSTVAAATPVLSAIEGLLTPFLGADVPFIMAV